MKVSPSGYVRSPAGRRTPAPTEPSSRRILGIDWRDHLPFTLAGGVEVHLATLDEALAFTRAHYADIFGSNVTDTRFLTETSSPAKLRFLAEADRFVFRDGGEAIGLLVGHPTDWSTYYWRTVAFLPEYQGRGLLAAVLERTDRVMCEAGVARVEGEAAPTNYRQIRLLARLGYCVTGTVNSERWGTMLRLTKFLATDAEQAFVMQFCRDVNAIVGAQSRRNAIGKVTEGGCDEEVRTLVDVSSTPANGDA